MKRILLIFIMITVLILPAFSVYGADDGITVTVNGVRIQSDTPAVIVSGSTMLPFRAIFNALGVGDDAIKWNPNARCIEIRNGNTYIFLVIGSTGALVNDKLITLNAAPIFFSSAAAADAAAGVDPDGMAVLLNNDFSGQSAVIDGSLYTANGNVAFNNAGDNNVTGNIYHKTGTSFTIPAWYTPDFANRVVTLDSTAFNEAYPGLIDTPNISNYVANCNLTPNSPVLTISENTHYGKLTVGQNIIVDVSSHDIYLVVDTLTCNWGYNITLQGGGKLFLFVNAYRSNGGPLSIDNGGNPDRTYVVSNSSLSNAGLDLYAHVFYKGFSSLTVLGKITGSVVTDAAALTISGGGNVVDGLLYAPNAAATVSSPGYDTSGNIIP